MSNKIKKKLQPTQNLISTFHTKSMTNKHFVIIKIAVFKLHKSNDVNSEFLRFFY